MSVLVRVTTSSCFYVELAVINRFKISISQECIVHLICLCWYFVLIESSVTVMLGTFWIFAHM